MTVTNAELTAEVLAFRSGILDGRASDGMCAVVCVPLQGYLSVALRIETEVVGGDIDIEGVAWRGHVWLMLPDGRVLDPTIDQFNDALSQDWPAVYLGDAIPEVHQPSVRLIDDVAAAALATIEYRNTKFDARRLYTAWDNLKDEKVFFRGVDRLADAGIPSKHLMAYMLIGYDPAETWDRIWHRFGAMVARGIEPYPMVYDRSRADLLCFQRWVITGLYRVVPWDLYRRETKSPESVAAYGRQHVESVMRRAA